MTFPDWLETSLKIAQSVAAVGALVGVWAAFRTYRTNVKWGRKKYASETVRSVFAEPKIQLVMEILDFPSKSHRVPSASEPDRWELRDIGDLRLRHVLKPALIHNSALDLHLRDCFDHFIKNMEWLQGLQEARLMKHEDFSPYFGYWCEMLSGRRHVDAATLESFWAYCFAFHNGRAIRAFVDGTLLAHLRSKGCPFPKLCVERAAAPARACCGTGSREAAPQRSQALSSP